MPQAHPVACRSSPEVPAIMELTFDTVILTLATLNAAYALALFGGAL